jgi:hypothetical protein
MRRGRAKTGFEQNGGGHGTIIAGPPIASSLSAKEA